VGNEKLPLHSLNIRWWRKQMLGDEKSEDFSIKTTEFETILPSGKRLHNYGNSPFLMGKSTIYKWSFSMVMLVYQRVHLPAYWLQLYLQQG
jgi:hypothetical protein